MKYLLTIFTIIAMFVMVMTIAMNGGLRLKGEQLRPKYTPMLSQKVWSTTECIMLCYQYIQRCLSILLQQTQEELQDKTFKCVLYLSLIHI